MKEDIFVYSPPQAETPEPGGPLRAMRVAIQPNLSVKGWPTEAGSRALENFTALDDAAAVIRLRRAGAAIAGSVRMSELGLGLAGDASWQVLEDGRCDAALVTDTLGESRVSASLAGAVGFKPSWGVCSRRGLVGLVPSMEAPALIASKPGDIAQIMGAIAGPDPEDPSMIESGFPDFSKCTNAAPGAPRMSVIRESLDLLEKGQAEAFRESLKKISSLGLDIQETGMEEFPLFRTVHQIEGSVEASSAAGKYDSVRYGHRAPGTENWNEMYIKSRGESFGTLVKSYLFQGAYFQFQNFAAFEDACRIRARLVQTLMEIFEKTDFLLLPARLPGKDARTAGTISEVYDAFALTCGANVAGLPALCLPGYATYSGEDAGLQIWAPRLKDAGLLSLAAFLFNSAKGER